MNSEPIFIIGVQRSGTTLLAAMLAAHSRLSCGPETHFFRRLSEIDPSVLCASDSWPDAAVEFLYSITFTNYQDRDAERAALPEKYRLSREQVFSYLKDKEPSIKSILSAVVELYMRHMGKQRWIEKTPDHIHHLEMIRQYFPDSPVIYIVRDPRDVGLSLTKVPWGAKSFPEALVYWERLDHIGADFVSEDRNCYAIRYEDLVAYPRDTLQELCGYLGEVFEEDMLVTSNTGKEVNSQDVAWKSKASQPADSSRLGVWRKELSSEENSFAEAILGDHLEKYGYERLEAFSLSADIYPSGDNIVKYADQLKGIASKGVRFWKAYPDETASVKIFLGDPSGNDWLAGSGLQHIIDTLKITAGVALNLLSNKRIVWIPDGNAKPWTGACSQLLKLLLAPYRTAYNY